MTKTALRSARSILAAAAVPLLALALGGCHTGPKPPNKPTPAPDGKDYSKDSTKHSGPKPPRTTHPIRVGHSGPKPPGGTDN